MKLLKSILLMVVVLSFNNLYSQTQSILYCGEGDAVQNQFYQNNGLQNVYIVYQDYFVVGDATTYDKKMMESAMDKIIPDKNATGYGILDWEGTNYNLLVGWYTTTADIYKQILTGFIGAIHYAKLLRPNIKWAYYNMHPNCWISYTPGNEGWVSPYIPLLKEMDFLAPSVYLMYDGATLDNGFQTQTITSTIQYSLELGQKLNKPVYAFVWNRYHPNSSTNGNKLVDVSVFGDYISRLIAIQAANRKINGIIWWNCDDYLYSVRSSDAVLTAEFQNVSDFSTYETNLLQSYMTPIKSLFP